MLSLKNIGEKDLRELISRYYEISEWNWGSGNTTFSIANFHDYPEDQFDKLSQELEKIGFIAFTIGDNPVTVNVVESSPYRQGNEPIIKSLLIIATLISIAYFGYSYQSSYDPGGGTLFNIGESMVFYFLPVVVILSSREVVKYATLKKHHMKYSIPILVPDPIGLGTMGLINSPKLPYKNRKVMVDAAVFSLIAGFTVSVIFFVIGAIYTSTVTPLTQTVNLPVEKLGSPFLLGLGIDKFIPTSAIPDTIEFAGWVGIITTSFNALPLGFLDGGLIGSSVFGKNSIFVSYLSILLIVALSIFYAPWIVLALFAILVGVKGPQALNNATKLRNGSKVLIGLSFLIIILGITPVPIHPAVSQFSVSMSSTTFLELPGSQTNISFNATLHNVGPNSIIPGFSFDPSGNLHIQGSGTPIVPGQSRSYSFTVNSSRFNIPGMQFFNFTVYSGTDSHTTEIRVLKIHYSYDFLFNASTPYKVTLHNISTPAVLSLLPSTNQTFNIVGIGNDSYSVAVDKGGSLYFNSTYSTIIGPVNVDPEKPLSIPVRIERYGSPLYIVAYNSSYYAALSIITVQ